MEPLYCYPVRPVLRGCLRPALLLLGLTLASCSASETDAAASPHGEVSQACSEWDFYATPSGDCSEAVFSLLGSEEAVWKDSQELVRAAWLLSSVVSPGQFDALFSGVVSSAPGAESRYEDGQVWLRESRGRMTDYLSALSHELAHGPLGPHDTVEGMDRDPTGVWGFEVAVLTAALGSVPTHEVGVRGNLDQSIQWAEAHIIP